MKSSTGAYYVGLDHARALAAFLVFMWHFMHIHSGHLEPLPGTFDFFGFSLFAEGHTGVSLFMVLSGYLFARLNGHRTLDYGRFYAARALRLLPLLIAVSILATILAYVQGGAEPAGEMLRRVALGVIYPTLPNGGWSITVEAHFYLAFPVLLLLERRWPGSTLFVLAGAMLFRALLAMLDTGYTAQDVAYWTIFGRIDQFIIGMLLANYGAALKGRHIVAAGAGLGLLLAYHGFDRLGGYYGNVDAPDIWVFWLTLEGLLYGVVLTWYDLTFKMPKTGVSGVIAKIGAASYSIYLLHVFVVFRAAAWIDAHVLTLDTFYRAFAAGAVVFLGVAAVGRVSYSRFELFWLKFRKPYIKPAAETPGADATPAQKTPPRSGGTSYSRRSP